MEHIAYLDNSATTQPCKTAVEYINNALNNCWGNPSSLHSLGMEAELTVNRARECIAHSINAEENEIIFTSCGTEANNTALLSVLPQSKRGGRVITTAVEHPSVLETVKRLENAGFEVVYLKPDSDGTVPLEALKNELSDNTVLVSMMLVNNETGAVMPVSAAAKLVKSIAPKAIFHCDAVQGYGKLPINVKSLGIDMLTASAHKIHGPKGIGFLYCKKGIHLIPFITGGGQERGLRSGTESVPLIAGFHGAVADLPKLDVQLEKQQELYNYSKERLLRLENIKINSADGGLPYIMNISFSGYRSETVLHFLERKGIYVSSGSACAKGHGSYVLNEMGLPRAYVDSALRLSFSRYNTNDDIDRLCAALCEAAKTLRKASK